MCYGFRFEHIFMQHFNILRDRPLTESNDTVDTLRCFWSKNVQKSQVRRPSLGLLREGETDKSLDIWIYKWYVWYLLYLICIWCVYDVYTMCIWYDLYTWYVCMICTHDLHLYSHLDNLSQIKHDSFDQVVQLQDVPLEVRPNPAVDALPISLHWKTFWHHLICSILCSQFFFWNTQCSQEDPIQKLVLPVWVSHSCWSCAHSKTFMLHRT